MNSDSPLSYSVWSDLVAASGDRLHEACDTYLYEADYYLIKIREAVDAQDTDALHTAVLSLKSIALTIGAMTLASRADSLLESDIRDAETGNVRLEELVKEFARVGQFVRTEIAKRSGPRRGA